jgi:heterodisulfide reductase subunit A-like polyferredoxin
MNTLDKSQNVSNKSPPIGAVMVVGGGIAGMQASLDLADQGFKVYLVEKKSAIGGHMAQLDKTFPTNDCAMCNISPKLVDTGRHLNIDILTNSEVTGISGEVGNFQVNIGRSPRYIDTEKCISCGECAIVCPVSVPDSYEEGLAPRKAAYKLYSQAVPSAYAIDKLGTAPCRSGCPAGQRAQGYIALIAEGRFKEAFQVIKEDNPFPSVCGRTCHHPCESKCSRNYVDEAVGIMSLKRFVTDYALAYGRERVETAPRTKPEWVAVVGSGPAGLTAAHDLAKKGYGVTVYEALPVAGGMMRVGIPAHRLPKGVLQQDIDDITDLGVVIKTNSPVEDPTKLLKEGYHAVCLATGISTRDHSLGIPGEDAQGVLSAATFLRKINLGEPIQIGDKVAVVGGGITALDAAAVARRLGSSEVYVALDRPRGELPAYHLEVAAVEAEGIHMHEQMIATRVITENGNVVGIELAQTGKGMVKDESGRRIPKTKPGTETIIEVDTVIGTVSQFSDITFLSPEFDDLEVDTKTFASQIPGLFVVGGRKTGASYIIEAVKLGHQVSKSIDRYLQNKPLDQAEKPEPPTVKLSRQELAEKVLNGEIIQQPRLEPRLLPMEERVTSFREVVLGYTEHQARAEAQRCLQCGICSECLACVEACGVDAIDHEMVAQEETLEVGAVILAPGYQAYQAELSEEYGLGRYPNVVTALQYERLLSASGPTGGHILRPSDSQHPKRIAFLQCIGSRDQNHDYCSAVCCMYATKEAIMTKEHHPDTDIHIFMMDMRAFSKGYWGYYQRSHQDYGVEYIRSRVSSLVEDPDTKNLSIQYLDPEGNPQKEQFDLVVLSVGMEISESVRDLANQLGIEVDQHGFCKTVQFNPIKSSRPGIYVAGPFSEPKDIPESVVEASGAASAAAAHIAESRFSLSVAKEYPPEKEIDQEDPRVGVFVCHCGSNIAGYLDVEVVAEYAKQLPCVVHAETNLYACSQDSIGHITEQVEEHDLNRVVVASCTPLTHQPIFQDSIRAAGLNPYLFEMANIRNQCSWVHSKDRKTATEKAKELVSMSVARAAQLQPQQTIEVPVTSSALVVGGGAAGMQSSISLAQQGFQVDLIEMTDRLGGNLNLISVPSNGTDPQIAAKKLIDRVESFEEITVHLNSKVVGTSGFKGNFATTIENSDGLRSELKHGATILAVGGEEYRGPEYGYGSNDRIVTQQEFEDILTNQPDRNGKINSLVMIQCIGPAEEYCSRICCSVALKNALVSLDHNPDSQVTIIYRDIRTYGFKERLYTKARDRGVVFVRYDDTNKPEVKTQGEKPVVKAWDPVLQQGLVLEPDLLVLSMPVVPREETRRLAAQFKTPFDAEGFLLEAHVKLRPVDFSTDGVFMAGMAHYPKMLDESLIQAQAAASRAARILSQKTLKAGGQVAVVDPALCTGCLTCVRICSFNVPKIQADLTGIGSILGAAYIEPSSCQGCGSCVAECPAYAIQLMHYTDRQMIAKVNALFTPPPDFIPLEEVLAESTEGGTNDE